MMMMMTAEARVITALRGQGIRSRAAMARAIDRYLQSYSGRRRSVRYVDERAILDSIIDPVKKSRKSLVGIRHGGSVANAYGYEAYTEALLVCVVVEGGVTYVWWGANSNVPANKVTLGGAAEACGPAGVSVRPLFDLRYGEEAKAAAWAAITEYTLERGFALDEELP
jgi:hypothetical protein